MAEIGLILSKRSRLKRSLPHHSLSHSHATSHTHSLCHAVTPHYKPSNLSLFKPITKRDQPSPTPITPPLEDSAGEPPEPLKTQENQVASKKIEDLLKGREQEKLHMDLKKFKPTIVCVSWFSFFPFLYLFTIFFADFFSRSRRNTLLVWLLGTISQ